MEMDLLIDDILKAIKNGKDNDWLIRTDIQTAIEMYIYKSTDQETRTYDDGYADGYDDGYDEGYKSGCEDGRQSVVEIINNALSIY